MKILSLALIAAEMVAAAFAFAIPPHGEEDCCCTQDQVDLIAQTYHDHLSNPDRQAAADAIAPLLTDDYVQYSGSVNSLAGAPVSTYPETLRKNWQECHRGVY